MESFLNFTFLARDFMTPLSHMLKLDPCVNWSIFSPLLLVEMSRRDRATRPEQRGWSSGTGSPRHWSVESDWSLQKPEGVC
jgi:hypothetical protein